MFQLLSACFILHKHWDLSRVLSIVYFMSGCSFSNFGAAVPKVVFFLLNVKMTHNIRIGLIRHSYNIVIFLSGNIFTYLTGSSISLNPAFVLNRWHERP